MIQKEYDFSHRTLVEQLQENPYFQYFIGLPGFQLEAPFVPSLLVEFRKRLTDEILMDINEIILKGDDDDHHLTSGSGVNNEDSDTQEDNKGTLILQFQRCFSKNTIHSYKFSSQSAAYSNKNIC